ncbi:MAG: polyamine aminopropyltransferase [candidate division Zixibacteria bacterium]|nr:polyamine aminopropyltransferase [candidate division Zixibacteria bacterium]
MHEQKTAERGVSVAGMEDLWNVWYSELHEHCAGLTVKVDRVLESTQSDFQRIDVLENKFFGKILVLYGSLMACDNDNNAYNEMITHVPLFTHPNPRNVLIIGGGDCGALTEVLKHPVVEKCTMCEIDKMVVEVSQRHLPHLTTGLDDPRANVIFADGKHFIENTKEKFELITLDLSDPIGPAADLFQKPFHQKVYDTLTDNGIMIAQSESPFYHKAAIRPMYENLKDIFPIVKMYTAFMPIYPSAYWSFAFCSKKYDPPSQFDQKRYDKLESSLKTRYYNAEIHKAAFALPPFVKELID